MRRWTAATLVLFLALGAWIAIGTSLADPPADTASAQSPAPGVGHIGDASAGSGFPTNRPFYVVAIGSDARPGVCEPVERCLADSIHLIGVNPRQRGAGIIGIPRDSYVDVPGQGSHKINDSLFLGGPELVVETVEAMSGVSVDYYFLTSFEGFRHMVEDIGGIEVPIPYPMSDSSSGATFDEGPQLLDGPQALAFARNRKDTPNGDFSRTENQGLLMLSALQQFQHEVRREPLRLFSWLILAAQNIQSELGIGELFDLALASLSLNPDRIVNVPLPGGISSVGGASVVTVGGEADATFADLADDGMLEGTAVPAETTETPSTEET